MSLRPTHAVIGSTDLDRSVAFLEAFGLVVTARQAISSAAATALYGLEADTEEVRLDASGADRGWIRLVRTPHAAPVGGPCARGAHAIDLYGRDIQQSVGVARRAGADCSQVGRYTIGPLQIDEVKIVGPDHLALVVIAVNKRRPSLLDRDAERRHSELHSAVWATDNIDEALTFWRDVAGLQVLLDTTVREPAVATFMGLPRPDTALRLAVLADGEGGAPRVELLGFPEDDDVSLPSWPLRAGLHALGASSDDPEATARALPGVRWGTSVTLADGTRAIAGDAPGGVRLELRNGGRAT